jgi:hypothetical protein
MRTGSRAPAVAEINQHDGLWFLKITSDKFEIRHKKGYTTEPGVRYGMQALCKRMSLRLIKVVKHLEGGGDTSDGTE